MSKDELMNKLNDKLEDELEDVEEYVHMAHEAREHGCDYLAKGLEAIARDEYSHADFLKKYLKDHHDHDISHELKAKFDEVTRRIWD